MSNTFFIAVTVVVIAGLLVFLGTRAGAKGIGGGFFNPQENQLQQEQQQNICDLAGYYIMEGGKTYHISRNAGTATKVEVTLYDQGQNTVAVNGQPNVQVLRGADYEVLKAKAFHPDYQWYRDQVKEYCPN